MEQPPITAFFDEEWESLSKMFSSEDADFMLQLHGHHHELLSNCSVDGGLFFEAPTSHFWPLNQANLENVGGVGESFLCYDDAIDYSSFQNISQESSHSSGSDNGAVLSNLSHGFHLANNNDINVFQVLNDSSDQYEKNDNAASVPAIPDGLMAHILSPMDKRNAEEQPDSGSELQLKRRFAKAEEQQAEADEKLNNIIDDVENPKKKSRVSRNGQKNKRNNVQQPKPRKNQKAAQICKDDDEANAAQNGQISSCSYSSEDDSNASQVSNDGGGEASDNKEPALNLNGKARAGRGSATDPQSLYARKRRERINERLRILQNLIPNGTKVDISTMLEEAVHYVNFLQLQIKLLSSDDMWMYAPIVYNGLDIGLYGRIFTSQ